MPIIPINRYKRTYIRVRTLTAYHSLPLLLHVYMYGIICALTNLVVALVSQIIPTNCRAHLNGACQSVWRLPVCSRVLCTKTHSADNRLAAERMLALGPWCTYVAYPTYLRTRNGNEKSKPCLVIRTTTQQTRSYWQHVCTALTLLRISGMLISCSSLPIAAYFVWKQRPIVQFSRLTTTTVTNYLPAYQTGLWLGPF